MAPPLSPWSGAPVIALGAIASQRDRRLRPQHRMAHGADRRIGGGTEPPRPLPLPVGRGPGVQAAYGAQPSSVR